MQDVLERKDMLDKIAVAEKIIKDLHKKNQTLREIFNKDGKINVDEESIKMKEEELTQIKAKNNSVIVQLKTLEMQVQEKENELKTYESAMKQFTDDSKLHYNWYSEIRYYYYIGKITILLQHNPIRKCFNALLKKEAACYYILIA